MVRRYGWGPRSERLVDAAPHGHWRTTTFVAGLRSTGLVAPLVLDGPMTGEAFRVYVEQFLAPALSKGDVVVMDNLSAHKVAGIEAAIRARGCQPALPAALLAGSEPHRAGLRQAQGPAAKSRRPHAGNALDHHRPSARPLQPRRVPKLSCSLRLCVRVTRKCSRAPDALLKPLSGLRALLGFVEEADAEDVEVGGAGGTGGARRGAGGAAGVWQPVLTPRITPGAAVRSARAAAVPAHRLPGRRGTRRGMGGAATCSSPLEGAALLHAGPCIAPHPRGRRGWGAFRGAQAWWSSAPAGAA
jgi:hypothetical protein